ncbi:sigma-54-dependent Fis family transcriptional regulator [Candidatus Poribacteria bacterium]|nr:sigma-54-dependent Fis family transcriptional regulator [Candidatus Poribacteria bacterium]
MPIVLLLENNDIVRIFWEKFFRAENFEVICAASFEDAIQRTKEYPLDLIFLGSDFEDGSRIQFLKQIERLDPQMLIVIPTGPIGLEEELMALEQAVYDFANRALEVNDLVVTVKDALELRAMKKETMARLLQECTEYKFENIIAVSKQMQDVLRITAQVISSDATTVLLQGESGTGKEVLAKAIHYNSVRRNAPFVEVSCAAIPETLFESELFGYEKGAFTDAKTSKEGLLSVANGGTVFLDEISEVPLMAQIKLLKVLEERKIRKLGGTEDIKLDIRIISATNKDLQAEVEAGHFREDLYYRLSVFPIYLPPLRERPKDILPLVQHYIEQYNSLCHKNVKGVSFAAMQLLLEYDWPGNVRELRNMVERAVILANGNLILPQHLPFDSHPQFDNGDLPIIGRRNGFLTLTMPAENVSLESVEKAFTQHALETSEWNQTKAAAWLGISRYALRTRMKNFGFMEN